MTPACMGGFCRRRESCLHYQSDSPRLPAERLCETGKSDAWQPVAGLKLAEQVAKC